MALKLSDWINKISSLFSIALSEYPFWKLLMDFSVNKFILLGSNSSPKQHIFSQTL